MPLYIIGGSPATVGHITSRLEYLLGLIKTRNGDGSLQAKNDAEWQSKVEDLYFNLLPALEGGINGLSKSSAPRRFGWVAGYMPSLDTLTRLAAAAGIVLLHEWCEVGEYYRNLQPY